MHEVELLVCQQFQDRVFFREFPLGMFPKTDYNFTRIKNENSDFNF